NGQGAYFRKTGEQLLQESGALVLYGAAAVAIIGSLQRSGWRLTQIPRRHLMAHSLFIVPMAVNTLFDYWFSGTTLQYGFYQVFLFGGAMLQLAVLMDGKSRTDLRGRTLLIVIPVLVIAGLVAV